MMYKTPKPLDPKLVPQHKRVAMNPNTKVGGPKGKPKGMA